MRRHCLVLGCLIAFNSIVCSWLTCGLLVAQQVGHLGPQLLDLLGRSGQPDDIEQFLTFLTQAQDSLTQFAFGQQFVFVDGLPFADLAVHFRLAT